VACRHAFYTSIFAIPCSIFDIGFRKRISDFEQGIWNDEGRPFLFKEIGAAFPVYGPELANATDGK
jgi:hypothetical protein